MDSLLLFLIQTLVFSRDALSAPVFTIESLEELVDGFRKQQMTMSTTMLNASQNLGLPEKLAAAEVEEAEERTNTAFRGKNEAKTPFIATSSRLGLGYIGRGYDIYQGNPVSDDGEVDQGFRLPVIDLPFSFRFTSDGEYRIPDNVDVISETSSTFGSSFHQMKTETDYQAMLMVDVSVNANAEGWGASASFSASTSYQKQVKELTKGEKTTLDIVGRATVYKARMSSTGTMSKLSDFFEDAIRDLPSENCEDTAMQTKYLQVVKLFGTHYTTEVVMGAKAVQEFRFKNSDLDRFEAHGISTKVAAEISYGVGAAEGSAGFSVGVAKNQQLREMVTNTEKEQREYYIGGSPPSGDYDSGSTSSLREWARSAAENPAPIQYSISSIDALIRPEYFKKSIDGLYEKRKCLRKALFTYCTNSVIASHCGLLGETSAGGNNTLKFGDFVKVTNGSNGSKYLALSQNYGIAPGRTVKPLITVQEIKNYDGILQIVPPEGVDGKLGNDIHYGEPFLFRTIEGELLRMGKTMIFNSQMPSQARLLDVLRNTEERDTSVNITHSQVPDFSLFLTQEGVCSYVVSLRAICYTNHKPKHYQVEMIGSIDRISGIVTVQCDCGKNQGCGYPWHHSIVNAFDIGTINKIRIMGLYGKVTDGIIELRVKTLKDGEKRDVRWNRGECSGRVYELNHWDLVKSTKQIAFEYYPVQFTFHSKDKHKLLGQSVLSGDTGYMHVLSSLPRKSYWGQSLTHLMSVDNMGKIRIVEVGPKPHTPISKVCNALIYPSSDQFSHQHNFDDQILISFDVNVMVNYVEIEADPVLNFTVAYVNAENEQFMDFPNINISVVNNTVNLTLQKAMYTTAIKVYSTAPIEKGKNITDIINMIAVSGCPSAAIVTDNSDMSREEWTLKRSENEIQTSPYLKMIPKADNEIDPVELFKRTEVQVKGSFADQISLSASQTNCNISADYLQNYLSRDLNTEDLKIKNIKLVKKAAGDDTVLDVTMDITAMNQIEYDRGYMALNSTVRSAIMKYSCLTQSVPESALQTLENDKQSSSESFVSSNGAIAGFVVLAVLILIVLAFLVYRTYSEKVSLKEGRTEKYMMKPSIDRELNEYTIDDEETGHGHELFTDEMARFSKDTLSRDEQ